MPRPSTRRTRCAGSCCSRRTRSPGTVFAYNQPCTYTLAEIVRRVTGGSLVAWLRPHLLDPLGIGDLAWRRDDTGAELGYSGCYAPTDAVAKLGQLYLQGGVWDGERILDADWVEQATSTQVANPDEANPDWSQGYGFQFWMARHGFRGDGAYGQFCVVLPEQDVVLAMTGQSLDMQAVLDAVWQHLLPAVDRASDAASASALEARLAALGLPAVDGGALQGLADVGPLARDGDGWRLTLDVDGGSLSVPVGQEWAVEAHSPRAVPSRTTGRSVSTCGSSRPRTSRTSGSTPPRDRRRRAGRPSRCTTDRSRCGAPPAEARGSAPTGCRRGAR